jgi:hypothetical protein
MNKSLMKLFTIPIGARNRIESFRAFLQLLVGALIFAALNAPARPPAAGAGPVMNLTIVNQHCWKPNRAFSFSSKLAADPTTYYGRVSADGSLLSIFTDAARTTPYAAVPTLPRPSNAWGSPNFATNAAFWHNVGVTSTLPENIDWGYLLYGQDGYPTGPGAHWITDPVVYGSNGIWQARASSEGYANTYTIPFGAADYTPVAADFDGDGRTDFVLYNETTGGWMIRYSSSGQQTGGTFGGPGYAATAADFDGDGLSDPILYNRTNSLWRVLLSSTGYGQESSATFGVPGCLAFPKDFDGDGKPDLGVYYEDGGQWGFVLSSLGYPLGSAIVVNFPGISGCTGVADDFDGDRKTDLAVIAPDKTWWFELSASGYAIVGPITFNPFSQ